MDAKNGKTQSRGRGKEESGATGEGRKGGRLFPFSFLLFLSLLAMPAAHAANEWQPAVFAALLINLAVLGLFFVVITILRLEHFKGMLYDEFGHLAVTVILAVLLIGGLGQAEGAAKSVGCGFGASAAVAGSATCPSGVPDLAPVEMRPFCASLGTGAACPSSGLMDWAKDVNARHRALLQAQLLAAGEFNAKLGVVSGVNGFCNLLGVGVSIAGCSAYGVLRGPAGQLVMASGTGIMENKAEQLLLLVADRYALALLVPLGLVLRCLHFTRKAGGTLIALGLALWLVLPISVIMTQAIADRFVAEPGYVKLGAPQYPAMNLVDLNDPASGNLECDPFEPDEGRLASNADSLLHRMMDGGPGGTVEGGASQTEKLMFLVIVRTLLMGAFTLTMVIMSVRVLGRMLGSEIDVMYIARLS